MALSLDEINLVSKRWYGNAVDISGKYWERTGGEMTTNAIAGKWHADDMYGYPKTTAGTVWGSNVEEPGWPTRDEVAEMMYDRAMATTCGTYTYIQPMEEKRMVDVYQVFVLNRETEELLSTQTTVGEGEADAMLGFELTDEMKKLKRMDKLSILTTRVGQFEKYEIQEVRVRGGSLEEA